MYQKPPIGDANRFLQKEDNPKDSNLCENEFQSPASLRMELEKTVMITNPKPMGIYLFSPAYIQLLQKKLYENSIFRVDQEFSRHQKKLEKIKSPLSCLEPKIEELAQKPHENSSNVINELIQQQINIQISSMYGWMTERFEESFKAYQNTLESNINKALQKGKNEAFEYLSSNFHAFERDKILSTCSLSEMQTIKQNQLEINEKFMNEIESTKTQLKQLENSTKEVKLLQQGLINKTKTINKEIENINDNIEDLQKELKTASDDYKAFYEKLKGFITKVNTCRHDEKKNVRNKLQETQNKMIAISDSLNKWINAFSNKLNNLATWDSVEDLINKFKNIEWKIEDSLDKKFRKIKNDICIGAGGNTGFILEKINKWSKEINAKLTEVEITTISNIENTNKNH